MTPLNYTQRKALETIQNGGGQIPMLRILNFSRTDCTFLVQNRLVEVPAINKGKWIKITPKGLDALKQVDATLVEVAPALIPEAPIEVKPESVVNEEVFLPPIVNETPTTRLPLDNAVESLVPEQQEDTWGLSAIKRLLGTQKQPASPKTPSSPPAWEAIPQTQELRPASTHWPGTPEPVEESQVIEDNLRSLIPSSQIQAPPLSFFQDPFAITPAAPSDDPFFADARSASPDDIQAPERIRPTRSDLVNPRDGLLDPSKDPKPF